MGRTSPSCLRPGIGLLVKLAELALGAEEEWGQLDPEVKDWIADMRAFGFLKGKP